MPRKKDTVASKRGQERLRRASSATVSELLRQVAIYKERAADLRALADSEGRALSGFEWEEIDKALRVVRDILFKCIDYQFPKLQSIEWSPNEQRLEAALARIQAAAALPEIAAGEVLALPEGVVCTVVEDTPCAP